MQWLLTQFKQCIESKANNSIGDATTTNVNISIMYIFLFTSQLVGSPQVMEVLCYRVMSLY